MSQHSPSRVHASLAVLTGLSALWSGGALAQTGEAVPRQNEALVMRLIFEDCLGYVGKDRTPFAGMELQPLGDDAEDAMHPGSAALANRHQILNERYYAVWGQDEHGRHCLVMPVLSEDAPMRLLVDPVGFLDRVSLRASALGMTEVMTGESFNPLATNSWSEPGDSENELRLSVNAVGLSRDGQQAEVFIVSSGPGE